MITITRLAKRFGLSRTALLYYDRIGLLSPTVRSDAGYRLYTDADVERLCRICSYRNAGLSLDEIRQLLKQPDAPKEQILRNRLRQLDHEIGTLRIQQRAIINILQSLGTSESVSAIDKEAWVRILRVSGLSDEDMEVWHTQFERDAPAAHHAFLRWLGIAEEEILQIRAKSNRNHSSATKTHR
jgi:DNA-binding transcriptional MerR regulator